MVYALENETIYEPLKLYINSTLLTSPLYWINTTDYSIKNKTNKIIKKKELIALRNESQYVKHKYCKVVYEHFNGPIDDTKSIGFIDGDNSNYSLNNLQLIDKVNTISTIRHSARRVDATNDETKIMTSYKSIYTCSRMLNINPGIIKLSCENKCRGGISKLDNQYYTFKYSDPNLELVEEIDEETENNELNYYQKNKEKIKLYMKNYNKSDKAKLRQKEYYSKKKNVKLEVSC